VKSKSKTGIALGLGLTTIMVLALATTTIAQSASAVISEGCANYAPIEQCLGHDAIMTLKRFLDGIRDRANER
jgi:hypothetical protein